MNYCLVFICLRISVLCYAVQCVLFVVRLLKPATFADCLDNELPYGWELAYDPQVGTYYINHVTSENPFVIKFND